MLVVPYLPTDPCALDRHRDLARLQSLPLLDILLAGSSVGNPEIVGRVCVNTNVRLGRRDSGGGRHGWTGPISPRTKDARNDDYEEEEEEETKKRGRRNRQLIDGRTFKRNLIAAMRARWTGGGAVLMKCWTSITRRGHSSPRELEGLKGGGQGSGVASKGKPDGVFPPTAARARNYYCGASQDWETRSAEHTPRSYILSASM